MTNVWRVLGIPKGSDRAAIRRAYAVKLKKTNPEDNPDGFKKLREAYEWALEIADNKWVEFDDLDLDDPVIEPVDDHAGMLVDPVGLGPAHDIGPQADPVPDDPEAAELAAMVTQLGHDMASPWRDPQRVLALFRAIVAHPGMDRIDDRERVEFDIAIMIGEHVPASDIILVHAIEAFEWDRVGRSDRWPYAAAIARHEEWHLIAAMERPDHHFHRAWMALTRAPKMRWSRRLLALTPHAARIGELIDIIDYRSPGLLPSTLDHEVAWWRERVAAGTTDIVHYGWAPALGLLAASNGSSTEAMLAWGLLTTIAVAADRLGTDRGYALLGAALIPRFGQAPRWVAFLVGNWPPVMAALPILVLTLPATPWAAILVVTIAILAVLGLRLAGYIRPVPLTRLWSMALLFAVVIFLSVGGLLHPPPARLVMLVAAGLALTQPLISAMDGVVDWLDQRLGGFGALLVAVYGAGIVGLAIMASDARVVDPITAAGMVAMIVWVIAPIIASSTVMLVRFVARIGRGLAFFAVTLLVGLANPLTAGAGMSNGQAIVGLHLRMDAHDGRIGETASKMATMHRRNPLLYAQIRRALPVDPVTNQSTDDAVLAIDRLIDSAVPDLLPYTDAPLAAQYQRALIDVLYAMRKTDAASCADGKLSISPDLDSVGRHRVSAAMLAIAARGRDQVSTLKPVKLPSKTAFNASIEALRPMIDSTKIEYGAPAAARARCTDRIARAQALADLPDDSIATMFRLAPSPPSTVR